MGLQSFAQNTAYFSYSAPGSILKVHRTTDQGYIAIGKYNNQSYVVKFDGVFQVLWLKKFTSPQFVQMSDIIETNNGNYVMLCFYSKNGNSSTAVIKYNSSGTKLFNKCYYNPAGDILGSTIARSITGDGYVIGGGNCLGANFLIRCNDNGDVQWCKEFRETGVGTVQTPRRIITESSQYVFASYAAHTTTLTDVTVFKVDDMGTSLGAITIKNQQGHDAPQDMIKLSNGNYVIAACFTTTNQDNFYYFLNSAMTSVTHKKYVLSTDDHNFDMLEYEPNKILIVGDALKAGTTSNKRYLYFSIDATGNILWSKQSDGNLNKQFYDIIYCLAKGGDKQIVGMGSSYGDGASGVSLDFNGNGFCSPDTAILTTTTPYVPTVSPITVNVLTLAISVDTASHITVDTSFTRQIHCGSLVAPNSIEEIGGNESKLMVSPNPVESILNLSKVGVDFSHVTVRIYDMLGNIVLRNPRMNDQAFGSASFDLSNLQHGNYIIELVHQNKIDRQFITKH